MRGTVRVLRLLMATALVAALGFGVTAPVVAEMDEALAEVWPRLPRH